MKLTLSELNTLRLALHVAARVKRQEAYGDLARKYYSGATEKRKLAKAFDELRNKLATQILKLEKK